MASVRPGSTFILAVALVLTLSACDDDGGCTNCPGFEDLPFLTIEVVDGAGDPVAGVLVGAYPQLPDWVLQDAIACDRVLALSSLTRRRARVAIGFSVPQTANVTLEVLDDDDARLRSLMVGSVLAGQHTVVWDGLDDAGEPVPTGLYPIRLHALDAGGETLHSQVERAMLYIFDPSIDALGRTNADGIVTTDDTRRFPRGESFVARDETGLATGTVNISSALVIVVVDDDHAVSEAYCDAIELDDTANVVRVEFEAGVPRRADATASSTRAAASFESASHGVGPPIAWSLRVYPNPFN